MFSEVVSSSAGKGLRQQALDVDTTSIQVNSSWPINLVCFVTIPYGVPPKVNTAMDPLCRQQHHEDAKGLNKVRGATTCNTSTRLKP